MIVTKPIDPAIVLVLENQIVIMDALIPPSERARRESPLPAHIDSTRRAIEYSNALRLAGRR